jgi:hypothetical protein
MKTWKTCSGCRRFVEQSDPACPFCGLEAPCAGAPCAVRTFPSRAQALTGAVVITAGAAIAACTGYTQTEYGVASFEGDASAEGDDASAGFAADAPAEGAPDAPADAGADAPPDGPAHEASDE